MTYTVSEITSYIKMKFDTDVLFSRIYVKGEVSNCKYHPSGHIYFTLKDSGAQIACVMFAGKRPGISFRLTDGQSVIVMGQISVYAPYGSYQIYADEIRLDGIGHLYEEFEALKKRLGDEGLFDVSHKKKIPRYARTVGIVTASTGAAIRDICQISKRSNPYVKLILYPAQVQGKWASETIVRGIKALDGKADVIIVGRGGGSIEDLWAFNEEATARAIYECVTPIISAVGHETDTTIADFVSDLRAPTPSAGAELAVFDMELFEKNLASFHERLTDAMLNRIQAQRDRVKNLELRLKNVSPENVLKLKKQKTAELALRLKNAVTRAAVSERHRLSDDKTRLEKAFTTLFNERKTGVRLLANRLVSANPAKKLESGFSYVTDAEGQNVTSISKINKSDILNIVMTDGRVKAEVIDTEKARCE